LAKKESNRHLLIGVILVLAVVLVTSIGYSAMTGYASKGKVGKKPTYQCNDHVDNDGDGFCDFNWRKAYCRDGSTPGDPACISKDDNDESGDCTPACDTNQDCGVNGYIGDPYCWEGDVYRDYITYTCENAGKCSAVCNSQISGYLWDNCQGNGCSNGQCVTGNPDSCTDSDGGSNLFVKGTVSGYFDNIPYSKTEICLSSTELLEYYCGGNYHYNFTYNCAGNMTSACSNGACV
jgi:hypothetical protein